MTDYTTTIFGTNTTKWREDLKSFFNILCPWKMHDIYDILSINQHEVFVRQINQSNIVVFVITNETYGLKELALTGLMINEICNSNKYGIFYIEPLIKADLYKVDTITGSESNQIRTAIIKHLQLLQNDRIFLVNEIDNLGHVILDTYDLIELTDNMQQKWKG